MKKHQLVECGFVSSYNDYNSISICLWWCYYEQLLCLS